MADPFEDSQQKAKLLGFSCQVTPTEAAGSLLMDLGRREH